MYFPSLLARKVKLNLGVDTDFPLCCSFGIRFYGIGEPSREIDGRVPGGQYGMITKGHVHIPCACPIFLNESRLVDNEREIGYKSMAFWSFLERGRRSSFFTSHTQVPRRNNGRRKSY